MNSAGFALFDRVQEMILAGNISAGMDELVAELRRFKSTWTPSDWAEFARVECVKHPIKNILLQDPFTNHSFTKPRGYSGDAGLLDLIYRRCELPDSTTELGRRLFDYATEGIASKGVRSRRDLLARYIDKSAKIPTPRVLSVACGHLREAEKSDALMSGRIGELVAFDQDEESLSVVDRELSVNGVRTLQGSVRGVLTGKIKFEKFDLVYAAGLYDYLTQPFAKRLTAQLFEALNPGGTLLLANFLPTLHDVGYMETFMDWHLIYRDEAAMRDVATEIPAAQIQEHRSFLDEYKSIVFLEIVKG